MVASWPLTTRAALSLFSVKITFMVLCEIMGSESTGETQGIVLKGRPGKRWLTMMLLRRWAAFLYTVMMVVLLYV